MNIFARFRSKQKPVRVEPSIVSKRSTLNDIDPDQLFKEMSSQEIADWLSSLSETIPFRVMTSCIRRLYDIAFFDHGVSDHGRLMALKLVGMCNDTVKQQFAKDPEKLRAFKNATEFTESRIPFEGVNSLAWLLDEHKISPGDTLPFIMMPQHGALLSPFLQMIGSELFAQSKPLMVRQLVMQRQRRNGVYPNTVLHLHGLVCKGDAATRPVFTRDERTALMSAPQDYNAARSVLADLGLLKLKSNALPLNPPPDDSLLKFIVSQAVRDTLADESAEFLGAVPPPPGMEGLETIIPISLCINLGLTMIESLYGSEKRFLALDGIEVQFSEAVDAGLMRLAGMMRKVETIELAGSSAVKDEISVDQTMVFAAWQEFDQWPKDEDTWLSIQPYLQHLLERLHYIRIDYCMRVRSYLRFFINQQNADDLLPDVHDKLNELYVQYGSRSGVAEAASFGEDWIGLAI